VRQGERDGSKPVEHPENCQTGANRVTRLNTDQAGDAIVGVSVY